MDSGSDENLDAYFNAELPRGDFNWNTCFWQLRLGDIPLYILLDPRSRKMAPGSGVDSARDERI